MTLGERIKLILTERNIKQVDFARTLGVSANYVNLLVNGKKKTFPPRLQSLLRRPMDMRLCG